MAVYTQKTSQFSELAQLAMYWIVVFCSVVSLSVAFKVNMSLGQPLEVIRDYKYFFFSTAPDETEKKTYIINDLSWEQAALSCQERWPEPLQSNRDFTDFSRLAEVIWEREQELLATWIKANFHWMLKKPEWWIGLVYLDKKWLWYTGLYYGMIPFDFGEPQIGKNRTYPWKLGHPWVVMTERTTRLCVAVDGNGEWVAKTNCDEELPFVCSVPFNPMPAAATAAATATTAAALHWTLSFLICTLLLS